MCGASVFVHGGHYFSVSKISELLQYVDLKMLPETLSSKW